MNEKKCNKECDGIINEMIIKGIDFPSIISVEYKVNGKIYILKENLVMKKEKNIMLGFIPVGYSTKSQIELMTGIKPVAGNKVRVKYEESNPNNAYLINNKASAKLE